MLTSQAVKKGLAGLVLLAGTAFADSLMLHDGRTIVGSYLGGDSRNVRIAVQDRIETYSVSDIKSISFGEARTSSNAAPIPPPVYRESAPPAPAAPPSPPQPPQLAQRAERPSNGAPVGAEIPSGSVLTVRMIDDVDSERDSPGKTYRASLDEPVMDTSGRPVVQRGSDVLVKLVDDKESGKIEGKTVLTLDVVSLNVNGRNVDIDTASVTQESGSRTARSAKVIGGTAVLGTIIGAIAGGGKGAAIGAAAGAGAGTGVQVLTKGQRVRIPSETRLTFTLQQPVRI